MSESLYVKKEVNQQEYRQKNNDSRMHFYNPILQRELSQKSKLPDEQIYTAQLYSIGDTLDDSGNEEDLTDQPNLTGIPIYLKQHYEEQFGFSFDDVRVHYNSDKPAKLQALAYAQGNQVYMGPGQEIHLEHELGHVVQQKQGIVRPTTVVDGLPVNDDPQLEQEASTILNTEKRLGCVNQSEKAPVIQRLMSYETFYARTKHYSKEGKRGMHNGAYYDIIDPILRDFETHNDIIKLDDLDTLERCILAWIEERPVTSRTKIRNDLLDSVVKERDEISALKQQKKDQIESFVGGLKATIIAHIESATCDSTESTETLWSKIKECFNNNKNITMLISKILSATPQEVDNTDSLYATIELRYLEQNEILNLNESFELLPTIPTIFNSLNVPVSETLNDIFYWMKINNATDIEEIELTSSDIHNRGVGVCIVQYKSTDVSKKLVIKPEDKSFEKAVYSKDTDSLASDFNSALDNDMLGDKQKGSPIGQLDIQTSESNGSAIEYFKHKTFATMDTDEKERINKKSVENLVAFSSILGLSDLHYENAVYSEPDYLFQLIDAEVGMRYKLDSRYPIYTARYKGGMIDTSYNTRHSIDNEMEKNISFIDKNLMADFLDKVKVKLKDKSVRITLIETEKLFLNRMLYIKDLIEQDDIDKYYDELCESLNGLGPKVFLKASKEVCIAAAYTDFARGQIPYFELNLNNSTLYQKNRERNTIIAKFSDKDDSSYLDTIIADRMQKLVGIEDSTPEEGSQSPSEIEE